MMTHTTTLVKCIQMAKTKVNSYGLMHPLGSTGSSSEHPSHFMILSVRWDLWKAVKIAHMVFGLSRREKITTTSQEVPMPKQKKKLQITFTGFS